MEGNEGHNRAIEFGKHNQPLERAAIPWEGREEREQHDPLSGMGERTGWKTGRECLKISMNGCVEGGWMDGFHFDGKSEDFEMSKLEHRSIFIPMTLKRVARWDAGLDRNRPEGFVSPQGMGMGWKEILTPCLIQTLSVWNSVPRASRTKGKTDQVSWEASTSSQKSFLLVTSP